MQALEVKTYLELCVVGHHSLETDTDTLNDTEEDGAHDGRVPGGLETTSDGQGATGEETRTDGVPCILLLPDALDGAIKSCPAVSPVGRDSSQTAVQTYSRTIHPKHRSYHLGREREP